MPKKPHQELQIQKWIWKTRISVSVFFNYLLKIRNSVSAIWKIIPWDFFSVCNVFGAKGTWLCWKFCLHCVCAKNRFWRRSDQHLLDLSFVLVFEFWMHCYHYFFVLFNVLWHGYVGSTQPPGFTWNWKQGRAKINYAERDRAKNKTTNCGRTKHFNFYVCFFAGFGVLFEFGPTRMMNWPEHIPIPGLLNTDFRRKNRKKRNKRRIFQDAPNKSFMRGGFCWVLMVFCWKTKQNMKSRISWFCLCCCALGELSLGTVSANVRRCCNECEDVRSDDNWGVRFILHNPRRLRTWAARPFFRKYHKFDLECGMPAHGKFPSFARGGKIQTHFFTTTSVLQSQGRLWIWETMSTKFGTSKNQFCERPKIILKQGVQNRGLFGLGTQQVDMQWRQLFRTSCFKAFRGNGPLHMDRHRARIRRSKGPAKWQPPKKKWGPRSQNNALLKTP